MRDARKHHALSLITLTTSLLGLLADSGRSSSDLAGTVQNRVRKLMMAAATVPRHREAMQHTGYDPQHDFSGIADLSRLPVMTKEELKAAPENFLQEDYAHRLAGCFSDRTSGSTGMPLTVCRSKREREIQVAKWMRLLLLSGYCPTDKVFSFTSPGRLDEGRSMLQQLGLLRRHAVDYTLPPEVLTDELLRCRPAVVYGVRTSLLMVADELAKRSSQAPAVKLLLAGGEVIDASTRRRCREAFGVEITETYGTVEMGVMAWQQKGREGLSLISDCTLFEFLDRKGDPAAPGQWARIIVTDLHGWLMPFIRYDQGDLATYKIVEDERGESVQVIDRIIGRQDDIATLPDGRSLTYLDFYETMDNYAGIRQFRIRQQAPDRFLVELAAEAAYYRAIENELLNKLARLSHLPLAFEIRLAERIPPDSSGKMRMLVQDFKT